MVNIKNNTFWLFAPFYLCMFVDSLGWGITYPVFMNLFIDNKTLILSSLSINSSPFLFETIIGIYCICMFLASPILGILADKFGYKRILLLSLIGTAVGFVICALAVLTNSIYFIIIGRIISGLAAGNLGISQATIADLSTANTLPKNLSYASLSSGIGFICGPMIGIVLMQPQLWGIMCYAMPFFITALLLCINIISLLYGYKEKSTKNNLPSLTTPTKTKNIQTFKLIFNKNSAVSIYFLVFIIYMFARMVFFNALPIIFHDEYGANATYTGWLISFFSLMVILGLLFIFPKISKYFSLYSIISTSFIIQIISYLSLTFIRIETVVWINIAFIALTTSFIYVAMLTVISQATDKKHHGQTMGIVGSIAALAWGIGPLIAGGLIMIHLWTIYLFTIIFMLLAASLFMRITKNRLFFSNEN